jgi:hypothetical protein
MGTDPAESQVRGLWTVGDAEAILDAGGGFDLSFRLVGVMEVAEMADSRGRDFHN